jgi:hypothetical protein
MLFSQAAVRSIGKTPSLPSFEKAAGFEDSWLWTPSTCDEVQFHLSMQQEGQCGGLQICREAVRQAASGMRHAKVYVGRLDRDSKDPVAKTEHPDGLFASGPLRKGEVLLALTGVVTTKAAAHTDEVHGRYQMEIGEFVIDCTVHRNVMSFANDCRPSRPQNCTFMMVSVGLVLMAVGVVIRDVPEGGQVLVDYGEEYWGEAGGS